MISSENFMISLPLEPSSDLITNGLCTIIELLGRRSRQKIKRSLIPCAGESLARATTNNASNRLKSKMGGFGNQTSGMPDASPAKSLGKSYVHDCVLLVSAGAINNNSSCF